jgi:hypothetical protein
MARDRRPRDPAARAWRWTWAGAGLLALVVLAGGQGPAGEVALGRALFHGARPLTAHLAGQSWALPPTAVACRNCHQPAPASLGPPLTRASLTGALARRGGPPSSYDRARLCRAMREGVDPALVIIPQAMPRYVLTEDECAALWAYLLTRS